MAFASLGTQPEPVTLDIDRLRADTPGCAHRVHLNHAGAALPTRRTLDAVIGHLELEATIGGYEAAAARADELMAVRASAARLLGATSEEVAITTSDTAAWAKALWGFGLAGGFRSRRRVLVDRVVYNSHWFGLLQASEHFDLQIDVMESTPDGTVELTSMERLLDDDVALVTATHVPTHTGSVNPVVQIGELAREAAVPYFLDACQSLGQLRVDVDKIGCDVLTATGRKWLRGPRGTGLLFVAAEIVDQFDPPGIDASSAEWVSGDAYRLAYGARRFEEFEAPVAAQLGLGAAIDQLLELGIEAVAERIDELSTALRSRLVDVHGVHLTDGEGPRSGIVTFTVEGRPVDQLVGEIAAAGINVSIGRASHARLDMDARHLDAVIRASPHVVNTHDELDRFVEVVRAGS